MTEQGVDFTIEAFKPRKSLDHAAIRENPQLPYFAENGNNHLLHSQQKKRFAEALEPNLGERAMQQLPLAISIAVNLIQILLSPVPSPIHIF